MSNNNNLNVKQKKKNQPKYQKPSQPIYRPPSARIESSMSGPNLSSSSFMSTGGTQVGLYNSVGGNHPSDIFLIKQPSTSFGNVISNVFPIRGVLKRSKSFGNNNNNNNISNNNRSKNTNSDTINKSKYHYLNDSMAGAFFITLESISKENITIIKQALNQQTCKTITMTQLLQIIRILCNKVLDKSNNASIVAKVCLEIHHNQQLNMIHLSDHKYLFLESLANCLREWFNERDKLRFTTGGARRWTNYITFLMEIYINLKESIVKDLEMNKFYLSDSNDDDDDDYDDDDDDDDDDDVNRSSDDEDVENVANIDNDDDLDDFSNGQNQNNDQQSSATNDSSQADSSSCKSGSSERFCTTTTSNVKKTSSTNSIEMKIINSLLAKQQKQFANLLFDSFQVILINPNSTPAEIECMQIVFRRCGKYLDEDNPSRIKALIFLIRDILLNCSAINQFVNAHNNNSLNSSISKNLLEIIELYSSGWQFDQSQQIYYFPYTKID
ncbi:RNA binding [Dermatophagoides farinae]|uniref:RNA binding n=1 Tax=Dermatophagoides farinae TaxID=6954 RepID=A0A922I786_DERFA|nr:RNA binding [Dermatophagoides farinae]